MPRRCSALSHVAPRQKLSLRLPTVPCAFCSLRTLCALSETKIRNAARREAHGPVGQHLRICQPSQLTINVRAVLSPPLEHPTSPEPPLGVCTITLTAPGPEITPVDSVTFNSALLTTLVARGLPLISTCEAATNCAPFTVKVRPCCTCAKSTVLGVSDPIMGTGRALPQNGFSVLLQPGRNKTARSAARVRRGMEMLLSG